MKACKTERALFFFGFFVVVSRKNQTHSHRPPPATPARGERELLALPCWHRASWFGSLGGWFWLEKWDFGAWGACRAWLRVLMSHVELCCHCHTAGGERGPEGSGFAGSWCPWSIRWQRWHFGDVGAGSVLRKQSTSGCT